MLFMHLAFFFVLFYEEIILHILIVLQLHDWFDLYKKYRYISNNENKGEYISYEVFCTYLQLTKIVP